MPYNISSIKKKTRPNRATWLIFTFIAAISLVSYIASGAPFAVIFLPIAYFLGRLITAIFSLKFGEGGWTVFDRWCIFGVAIALIGWKLFDSPFIALSLSILTDLFGSVPTLRKSFVKPFEENLSGWVWFQAGAIINLFAIPVWSSATTLMYPLYIVFINALIIMMIFFRRKQSRQI